MLALDLYIYVSISYGVPSTVYSAHYLVGSSISVFCYHYYKGGCFFLCLLYDVLYHADIIMMILRVFFNVLVRPDGKVYKDICDMAKMPF